MKLIKITFMLFAIMLITGCGCEKKSQSETSINSDGTATIDVIVSDVTFSDVNLDYEDGVTTLTANMKNNTKDVKNFTLNIILKDEANNEVKKLRQIVENLDSNKTKVLEIGILGYYKDIKNVEFIID